MRRAPLLVRFPIVLLTAVIAVAPPASAGAAPAVAIPFMAHQAVYDLALKKARGNATVNSVRGRIIYSFAGNACEGYTTDFRQVSELQSGESKTTVSDLKSTSWEDADGKTYRFKIETQMNDGSPSAVDGVAERSGNTVTVKLKQPKPKTLTLDPATVFPTDQVRRIVTAAKEGKSVLELVVYDGSDDGERLYNTLTVIGQPIPGDHAPAPPDATLGSAPLKALTRWPVTVSYFDRAARPDGGEQTPTYAMSFELYENGVSRALVLDYNEFVISGAMSKLEVKDSKPCKP